jgi:hypothetical protein
MDSNASPQRYIPRRPTRVTITVPGPLFETLQERALHEGRSLSNLAAVLLERAMDRSEQRQRVSRSWDTRVNSRGS